MWINLLWINLLVILGTYVAVVVLGFFVYWIIINIKKTLRANQSNSIKGERQTPLTITKDTDAPSLEQPLNEADYAPDIQRENDTKTDDDWLNNGIPEASASTIKKEDDDWLNARVGEVPTNVYKQQDDEWLNAENNQPLETVDESSLNRATNNLPEIQIKQDGSILNITVSASKKQDVKSEQTVINLKINLPPQDLARKGEGPYDIEITTEDSSPSYPSLQDIITVKPGEEPVNQSHPLKDEISTRPAENQVTESHALMDEIAVRAVESPVLVSPQLKDEISTRPAENQVTESHALMDEIAIKPSAGPLNVEYELLDDLITKSAIYKTKKAKPPIDVVITNPVESPIEKAEPPIDVVITDSVESPIEKAEPVKTISINEITEFLKEKRDFKQAAIPSVATELRSTPVSARMGEGIGNLLSQAKNLYKKADLRGGVTSALAALRIYNNNEFYIQDTDLTHIDTLMQKPQIKDFTFKVLNTTTELDELIDGGYDLVMNFNKIKRGLKKGMVALLILVDRELASIGWAYVTEESKATLRGYPYNGDLDRQACVVGDWTNPKFQDSGISGYVKYKRQQLLKEKGFTFERSIVEDSIVKDLQSVGVQKRFELTYKRRTYTNVSLPGILGVEFWKEHPLNETDIKPPYQMITLLVLVLPSPPRLPI